MATDPNVKLLMEMGMICDNPDCTAAHVDVDHISFPTILTEENEE